MAFTAHAYYVPPRELTALLDGLGYRVLDLRIPMEQISELGKQEIASRLASGGDGDWPPNAPATLASKRRYGGTQIGIGRHGGFVPWLKRDWSRTNAVVINSAPHAHLFDAGTKAHFVGGRRVRVYSERGHRISRPESRRRIAAGTTSVQQPARPFMYLSDQLQQRAFTMITDYLFQEFESAA